MDSENLNLIIGAIILGAGLLMFLFSSIQLIKAFNSRFWPTTSGTILQSQVDRSPGRDRSRNFRANIVFEYKVSGEKCINNRISFSSKLYTSSAQRASKIVAAFKKDQQVTVYYPPKNPLEGILKPGANREQITGIILSLVFVIFGAFLLSIYIH